VNLPLEKTHKNDYEDGFIQQAMQRLFLPIIRAFKPNLILVSSGFDSHKGDPLGRLGLTKLSYSYMARQLMEIAPVVAVLEGGYNLENLADAGEALARTLLGKTYKYPPASTKKYESLEQAIKAQKAYWPVD
jgi:histone deacetylase 6